MKRLSRLVLVFTLLFVVAQPTYACVICLFNGECGWGGGLRCKPAEPAGCHDGMPCGGGGGGFTASLSSEYKIASVEVTHGDDATVQVAEEQKQPAAAKVARVEAPRK